MRKSPHTKKKEFHSIGIILRAMTMREDDLWVEIFSPDRGRFWASARHGRKSQKRFGTVLDVLNLVGFRAEERLDLRQEEKALGIHLLEANLIPPYFDFHSHLKKIYASSYILSWVRTILPESTPDEGLFRLVLRTLQKLHDGAMTEELILRRFEYQILKNLGYQLDLKSCRLCQKVVATDEGYFSYEKSGVLCSECAAGEMGLERLTSQNLSRILPQFLEMQVGSGLRSRQFLTELGLIA